MQQMLPGCTKCNCLVTNFMNTMKTIKPRNAANTRSAILKSAVKQFVQDGYDHAGLRAIAADAEIDPALICRYFGSKQQLFAEALDNACEESVIMLDGDKAGFGTRVAEMLLNTSRQNTKQLLFIRMIIRSSGSPDASKMVHQHIMKKFVQPFSQWLDEEKATEKAWLTASVLVGILIIHNIHGRQTIKAERLAAMLQSIIDTP